MIHQQAKKRVGPVTHTWVLNLLHIGFRVGSLHVEYSFGC